MAAALAAGIHQINVESVPELRRLSAVAAERGPDGAGGVAHQPRCRRVDPRKDRDRAKRKTSSASISVTAVAAYRLAVAARRQSGRVSPCISARSSSISIRVARAFWRLAELVGRVARTPGLPSIASISAAASASATAARTRRAHRLCDDWCARFSAHSISRSPSSRGACWSAPAGLLVARVVYVKEGGCQAVRDRRCGDERSDPSGDLRRVARYRTDPRSRSRATLLSAADVVGPVCETGRHLRRRS